MRAIVALIGAITAVSIPVGASAQTMEFYPIGAWNQHKIFLSAAGHKGWRWWMSKWRSLRL